MSTPSVTDIAVAIQTQLETITGLRTAPYLTDAISTPVALVAIDKVAYHGAFAGGDVVHTFTVYVIVDRASTRSGIASMEAYMSQSGDISIRAAIEADPTLGGVVSTSLVVSAGPPASITIGGVATYISVPFDVEVHA